MIGEDDQIDVQLDKSISELENGALMMWLMKNKDLLDSVNAGVEYFKSKYGLTPNVVILHPDDASVTETETMEVLNDIMVATTPQCLRKHCLVGIISSTDSVWGVQV